MRELRGFARIELAPGERAEVSYGRPALRGSSSAQCPWEDADPSPAAQFRPPSPEGGRNCARSRSVTDSYSDRAAGAANQITQFRTKRRSAKRVYGPQVRCADRHLETP
ncbi:hypothetical protein [Streptomyces sp. NPDC058545]|uniref:hypothetical protein n=1 Tax=Streptomyces sp. NPDC058545 TaxID=3346544 RepID=UPI00365FBEF7